MDNFFAAAAALPAAALALLVIALLVAFAFEFINGFHDTANAVTTVIYTRTLTPYPAVLYSGFMNFLGALLTVIVGGGAVAFGIVHLLPVDLLIDAKSNAALVMVLSLLLAGVMWNLGTWYLGLPVSSSHTLIGSILGVGLANSLWNNAAGDGVNWAQVQKVGLGLLLAPVIGFVLACVLMLVMKRVFRDPRLYKPPEGDDRPPRWIRGVLLATCGGVSFAHGSNDGQKGMGLLLLVLIGFMPVHYALSVNRPELAPEVRQAAVEIKAEYEKHQVPVPEKLAKNLDRLAAELDGKAKFTDLAADTQTRWDVRKAVFETVQDLKKTEADPQVPKELKVKLAAARTGTLTPAIEFIPVWVVVGTALALGIGTTVGYKRIVLTVAEKIGKSHLTYAQGAAAETVAATTIFLADVMALPVSTTQMLSSGVAGTMVANKSGVQGGTIRKILLAWVLTLPACMTLAAGLFFLGRAIFG